MKTKQIFILALAALLFSACSEDFLNGDMQGGTLTQDQYESLENVLDGTALSLYPLLYEFGGDHDAFGERAIDMYTDLLSGDMAMGKSNYGWFEADARGLTRAYRTSYVWYHYYRIIRKCNLAINAVEAQGIPEIPESGASLTASEYKKGFYYGQFLTLRGWAYASLMQLYIESADEVNYATEKAIPVYDESYTSSGNVSGHARSTGDEVYARIEYDLTTAIQYLDAFGAYMKRTSKLEVDASVARAHLAYAYLNWGGHDAQALKVAKELIDGGVYTILPNKDVLTNGFNDSKTSSWIWSEDVTVDNSTALASFFGQVDIYSYSYASAGDVKGIDSKLYDEIVATGWDIRADWFAPSSFEFPYAPIGKFFSAESKTVQGDRNWLADQVFLRIESAHLVAAEAAYNQGDLVTAVAYLDNIMSQRLASTETAATAYAAYKASLVDDASVKEAIIYNWRVEMWGEGYSLQTFRRLQKSRTLGANQYRKDNTLSYPDPNKTYTFTIPSAEYTYNQPLSMENLHVNQD